MCSVGDFNFFRASLKLTNYPGILIMKPDKYFSKTNLHRNKKHAVSRIKLYIKS